MTWNWELEVIVMHLHMCYATPLYSSRLFLWGLACEDPTRVFEIKYKEMLRRVNLATHFTFLDWWV